MNIQVRKAKETYHYEGDGLRMGDNIRTATLEGYEVRIDLTPVELRDKFLVKATEEFSGFHTGHVGSKDEIRAKLLKRAKHLRWCAEWAKFYHQPQTEEGWYVGTDYASSDDPGIYDRVGNRMMDLPRDIPPGDFKAVEKRLDEAWEPMP